MKQAILLLTTAVLAFAGTAMAADNDAPPRNTAGTQKLYYDTYVPAQRMRLRRETCMDTEQSVGAFCVKACQTGYVPVAGPPVRCRSAKPLPPGQFPGPVRREDDTLTRPATPPAKSGNPNRGV